MFCFELDGTRLCLHIGSYIHAIGIYYLLVVQRIRRIYSYSQSMLIRPQLIPRVIPPHRRAPPAPPNRVPPPHPIQQPLNLQIRCGIQNHDHRRADAFLTLRRSISPSNRYRSADPPVPSRPEADEKLCSERDPTRWIWSRTILTLS